MYAAMENKETLVRQMLKLGCEINAVNKEGYSPLHLGSMYAREPLVSLLLSNEANPNLTGGVSIYVHIRRALFPQIMLRTIKFV